MDFLNYYLKNYNNPFTELMIDLDLSNSRTTKSSDEKYKTQEDLNVIFRELVLKTGGKETWRIYLIIEKATGFVRVGKTQKSLNDRWNDYCTEVRSKINIEKVSLFYKSIKDNGFNKDSYRFILLDVQEGNLNARRSEEFFTIYFNRDKTDSKGFNLMRNNKYNPIVGDIYDSIHYEGIFNPIYVDIDARDIIELMKKGYERNDLVMMLNISKKTIDYKLRSWFGDDTKYKELQKRLIKPILKRYIIDDLTKKEISRRFKKLNLYHKSILTKKVEKAQEIYNRGVNIKYYSEDWVNNLCKEFWGINYLTTRDRFFLKPLLLKLMRGGIRNSQIANILNTLGIRNYRGPKESTPFNSQSIGKLIKRLWHESSSNIKDIVMSPIIEDLLIQETPSHLIGEELGKLTLAELISHVKRNKIPLNRVLNKLCLTPGAILNFLDRTMGIKSVVQARKLVQTGLINFYNNHIISFYYNFDYL